MVTRGALLALAAVTTTLFVFDLWATSVIDARSSNVVQGASFDGGRARLQRDAVIRQDGNSGMRGQQISATHAQQRSTASEQQERSVRRRVQKSNTTGRFHPSAWKPRLMAVVPISWPPKFNPRIEQHFAAILDTWGSHVDILRFLVSETELRKHPPEQFKWLPKPIRSGQLILGVPMKRGDDPQSRNIWEKMWRGWKRVAEEYIDKADFFSKVDLDAFYVAENMRVFGAYLDPDQPWYLGHTLFQRWGIQNLVYNSGTTYVLSRETLRRLAIRLRDMKTVCHKCGGSQCLDRSGAGEDPQTGGCLRDLGILPGDTLDAKGRQRFLPFRPRDHLFDVKYNANPKDWFWRYKGELGRRQEKLNCCSPYPIAFHNYKTEPAVVYDQHALHELEYFFHSAPYQSRIQGVDPPSGKLFQYDPNALDFQIDQHRNKKGAREDELIGKWAKTHQKELQRSG